MNNNAPQQPHPAQFSQAHSVSLPICLPADPNLAWVGAFIAGRLVALAPLEVEGESAVADLVLPKPFLAFGELQVRAGSNPSELILQS
ncbi:unannotated protein [freshwater metagenome]|uniref:Unannotated protein n=1 Tax=freshwater metagenome TaxID=449393 RepID=A0A6J6BPN1_9ZZZZ|nr:hypothetical protein [Actinomycetota bacterium]MTA63725.1 hypothetical protein [Actinomycetota bacterium]